MSYSDSNNKRRKEIQAKKAKAKAREKDNFQKKHKLGKYKEGLQREKKGTLMKYNPKSKEEQGEYKKKVTPTGLVKDAKDIVGAVSQKNTVDDVKKVTDIFRGVNPLNVKSVNKALNDGLNEGARIALDKGSFGLGTILTKFGQYLPFMKKDSEGRLIVTNKPATIVLWLLALGFVGFFFFIILLVIITIVIASAYFAVNNDSQENGTEDSGSSSSSTNNKASDGDVPSEIKGKALMPDMITFNSNYAMRKIAAYNYAPKMHYGIDYGYRSDPTHPIYSNMEGVVVDTHDGVALGRTSPAKGNYVAVYSEELKLIIVNQHLSPGLKVKKGDKVTVKTVIGNMGNTGAGNAYHLHLESYKNITPEIAKTYNANSFYARSGYVFNGNTILACTKNSTTPATFKEGVNAPIPEKCIKYQKKMRGIK